MSYVDKMQYWRYIIEYSMIILPQLKKTDKNRPSNFISKFIFKPKQKIC